MKCLEENFSAAKEKASSRNWIVAALSPRRIQPRQPLAAPTKGTTLCTVATTSARISVK